MCLTLVDAGVRPDLGAARSAYEAGPLTFDKQSTYFRPVRHGSGRTPVHAGLPSLCIHTVITVCAAAGEGNMDCLQRMIDRVAAAYCDADHQGLTAEDWAKLRGQSICGDYLALKRWQSRNK